REGGRKTFREPHARTHARIDTVGAYFTQTHTHTHTHTHTYVCTHTHTLVFLQTHTNSTCVLSHKHARLCFNTHTYILSFVVILFCEMLLILLLFTATFGLCCAGDL